jgi:hypothetical protein
MTYSFAIVGVSLSDIIDYTLFSFNVFKILSISVSPNALFGGLCDHYPVFYLGTLQYTILGRNNSFSDVPALRYSAVYGFTIDHFLF